MTEEQLHSLDEADRKLSIARANAELAAWDVAAAMAYTAAYHAAMSLVFRLDRRTPKTHGGLNHELNRLNREHQLIPPELVSYFSKAEVQRNDAFYSAVPRTNEAQAGITLAWAEAFIAAVRQALA